MEEVKASNEDAVPGDAVVPDAGNNFDDLMALPQHRNNSRRSSMQNSSKHEDSLLPSVPMPPSPMLGPRK